MKRRTFVTSAIAASTTLAASPSVFAQTDAGTSTPTTEGEEMTGAAPKTGYAPVNGLQMYYEIHGSGGVPLVLLHGAFATIGLWGDILKGLAQTRQVIAVETQGHGHTADIDRPLRYGQMADDTAALMEHLAIAQADVFGYSMGGGVALQLAIRHPELVRKLVLASASYTTEGVYPEVWAGVEAITPELFAGSPPEMAYLETAPHPDDFPALVAKVKDLESQELSLPAADIQAIASPTLLIIGDSDGVRPEHAVEMFRLLGGGVFGDLAGLPKSQLAVLPGTTHVGVVVERADLLLALIPPFLDAPMPQAP
ncbi:MAG: alpha/beta hydrolase [Chloroflexota bacterium]|nr:alpha/beta hydrolase [Chloroflexia bacterium]MDQ3227977.1 alpha/beta hydrolase [Chloroflexota bacterium]